MALEISSVCSYRVHEEIVKSTAKTYAKYYIIIQYNQLKFDKILLFSMFLA